MKRVYSFFSTVTNLYRCDKTGEFFKKLADGTFHLCDRHGDLRGSSEFICKNIYSNGDLDLDERKPLIRVIPYCGSELYFTNKETRKIFVRIENGLFVRTENGVRGLDKFTAVRFGENGELYLEQQRDNVKRVKLNKCTGVYFSLPRTGDKDKIEHFVQLEDETFLQSDCLGIIFPDGKPLIQIGNESNEIILLGYLSVSKENKKCVALEIRTPIITYDPNEILIGVPARDILILIKAWRDKKYGAIQLSAIASIMDKFVPREDELLNLLEKNEETS